MCHRQMEMNVQATKLPRGIGGRRSSPLLAGVEDLSSWPKTGPVMGLLRMDKDYLILKRASASRPSGEWNEDDFDVLADGVVVGRIMKVHAAPVGSPWMWTLAFGQHEDRTPTLEPLRAA